MSNSISGLESPLKRSSTGTYSVKLNIHYLDVVFAPIPDELIGVFLETTFSIFLSRYSRWDGCGDIDKFIEVTNAYEEQMIDQCIFLALDGQVETCLHLAEVYYHAIEQILVHYYHEFVTHMTNRINEDQIEFLIAIFEERKIIEIKYFNYDPATSDLYLFIPN